MRQGKDELTSDSSISTSRARNSLGNSSGSTTLTAARALCDGGCETFWHASRSGGGASCARTLGSYCVCSTAHACCTTWARCSEHCLGLFDLGRLAISTCEGDMEDGVGSFGVDGTVRDCWVSSGKSGRGESDGSGECGGTSRIVDSRRVSICWVIDDCSTLCVDANRQESCQWQRSVGARHSCSRSDRRFAVSLLWFLRGSVLASE